jgi:hypothetical protein
LLEAQAENETASLLAASTVEELNFLRGRISALLFIADLPQRVANANKEHYDRTDADYARANAAPDLTGHWGSPNFADQWDRRPADRRDAFGSGSASVEPGGSFFS